MISLPQNITTIPLLNVNIILSYIKELIYNMKTIDTSYYELTNVYKQLVNYYIKTKGLAYSYQKQKIAYIENNYPTTNNEVIAFHKKNYQNEFNTIYIETLSNIQSGIIELLIRMDADELELFLIEANDKKKYKLTVTYLLSNPITEHWNIYYNILNKNNIIMTLNNKKELEYSIQFLRDYQFIRLRNSFYEACSNLHHCDTNIKLAYTAFSHLNAIVQIAEGFDIILKNLDSDLKGVVIKKKFEKIKLAYRQTSDLPDDFFKKSQSKFSLTEDNKLLQHLLKIYPNIIKWDAGEQLFYFVNQSLLDVVVLLTNIMYQVYIKSFQNILNGPKEDLDNLLKIFSKNTHKQNDMNTGKERFSFERIFFSKVLNYLSVNTKQEVIAIMKNLIVKLNKLSHG